MKLKLSAVALAALAFAGTAQAALSAGDIAIIGRTNNGTPDLFVFVALNDIAAGETVYFTDNGWTGTGYRGSSATDGDGNESLTKWTASTQVAAGTTFVSTSAGFTNSGSVPGATSGSFASLDQSQSGDQINVFQNTSNSNPLFNVSTQTAIFAFDDTNGFENATNANQGNIPTGLSNGSTAVTVNFSSGGTIAVKSAILGGAAKTKAEWLAVIANPTNWATATVLPTGTLAMAAAVPEPESYALAFAGLAAAGVLARRRKAA
jgi:hypothetical protein